MFFLFSSSFSLHTLALACGLWFNLFDIIVFPISQPYPTRFQSNLSYSLHYAYSTSTVIVGLIWLRNITPQHILHSRVKDFITQTQLSFCVQILMEDLYVNVNFASKFL